MGSILTVGHENRSHVNLPVCSLPGDLCSPSPIESFLFFSSFRLLHPLSGNSDNPLFRHLKTCPALPVSIGPHALAWFSYLFCNTI